MDLVPQHRLRKVDRDVTAYVQIATGKERMIYHLDDDIEIPVLTPPLPCTPADR